MILLVSEIRTECSRTLAAFASCSQYGALRCVCPAFPMPCPARFSITADLIPRPTTARPSSSSGVAASCTFPPTWSSSLPVSVVRSSSSRNTSWEMPRRPRRLHEIRARCRDVLCPAETDVDRR